MDFPIIILHVDETLRNCDYSIYNKILRRILQLREWRTGSGESISNYIYLFVRFAEYSQDVDILSILIPYLDLLSLQYENTFTLFQQKLSGIMFTIFNTCQSPVKLPAILVIYSLRHNHTHEYYCRLCQVNLYHGKKTTKSLPVKLKLIQQSCRKNVPNLIILNVLIFRLLTVEFIFGN